MSPKSLNRDTRHNAYRQKADEEEAPRGKPESMPQNDHGLGFFFIPKSASTSLTATSQDANGGVGNMLRLLDPTS